MQIKEVASLAKVSVRTLHHYDEIGLLKPDSLSEAGYRIYSNDSLRKLQTILYYRELGFSLKQIKTIIENPSFNRLEALETQRSELLKKQKQLNDMMKTIDQSILEEKGERTMTHEERFSGFDFSNNPYEEEAKERWGSKAVDTANSQISQFGCAEQERMNAIYRKLADLRHLDPSLEESQAAIGDWYDFLNTIGTYTPQAFAGLGELYVADERFEKNIDQFGEGLASFMQRAMSIWAERVQ